MKAVTYYRKLKLGSMRKLGFYLHQIAIVQLCLGISLAIMLASLSFLAVGVVGGLIVILGRRSWSLLGVGLICGTLIYVGWFGPNRMQLIQSYYNQSVDLVGEVIADPSSSGFTQQVTAQVQSLPGLVSVEVPQYPILRVGDQIKFSGRLLDPAQEYSSDYATYLRSQNILYILSSASLAVTENSNSLAAILSALRIKLQTQIYKYVNEPQATLLAGILLGSKQNLDPEFKQQLAATGTSHIVAVSGYNVMLVVMMFLALSGYLPRKLVLVLATFGLCFFLLLVGAGNLSAQRAVIMGGLLLFSLAIGRKGFLPLSLLYAVTLMLIAFPLVWQSVSWQLSVGAMLGLIALSEGWSGLTSKLPRAIAANLKATLAVMLVTLPIVLHTFGQVSFISILANILVLPFIPIISYLGIAGIVSSYIFAAAAQPIFAACEILLKVVIEIIQRLSTISWGSSSDITIGLIFYLVLWLLWLGSEYISVTTNFRKQTHYVET